MELLLFKLHFKTPIHFGKHGIALEETSQTLGSDSLTSALINAWALHGKADEAIKALRDKSPAFILSSLYPFGPDPTASNKITFAFPRPMISPQVKNREILAEHGKRVKKICWVQFNDLMQWLNGKEYEADELEEMLIRCESLNTQVTPENENGWWIRDIRPRVAIDRNSANSSIWRCGTVVFNHNKKNKEVNAGLFGLVKIMDNSWKSRIKEAFMILGEMGLGGEKTYGLGTFDFKGFAPAQDILGNKIHNEQGQRFILLSRYVPQRSELDNFKNSFEAWDIIESKGYIVSGRLATTLKRKNVRMIVEGSVSKTSFTGQLIDVTPDYHPTIELSHRIFRSGLGFWLPAKEA